MSAVMDVKRQNEDVPDGQAAYITSNEFTFPSPNGAKTTVKLLIPSPS